MRCFSTLQQRAGWLNAMKPNARLQLAAGVWLGSPSCGCYIPAIPPYIQKTIYDRSRQTLRNTVVFSLNIAQTLLKS